MVYGVLDALHGQLGYAGRRRALSVMIIYAVAPQFPDRSVQICDLQAGCRIREQKVAIWPIQVDVADEFARFVREE